jgi:hypothetical protein
MPGHFILQQKCKIEYLRNNEAVSEEKQLRK